MKENLCNSSPVDTTTTRVTQVDRFKDAARQLEVDEDEAAFDKKLKEIAQHQPDIKHAKGLKDG